MKKLLLVLMMVFVLYGCEKVNLTNTVFISSIGLAKENASIKAIFYMAPERDISRNSSPSDEKTSTLWLSADSITDLFYMADLSLAAQINYLHIQSFIFHVSFLEDELLDEFFSYVKYSPNITYNSHIFATQDNIEDIYEHQNPGEVTELYNALNSPSLLDYYTIGGSKLMLLDMANLFYLDKRFLHIPLLETVELWHANKTIRTNQLAGIVAYDDVPYVFEADTYKGLRFVKNRELIILQVNGSSFELRKYRIRECPDATVFYIQVSFEIKKIFGDVSKEEAKEYILQLLSTFFDEYIDQTGYLYSIKNYNYLMSKRINPLHYELLIK